MDDDDDTIERRHSRDGSFVQCYGAEIMDRRLSDQAFRFKLWLTFRCRGNFEKNYVSRLTLANDYGVSKNTINRWIDELTQLGFLLIEEADDGRELKIVLPAEDIYGIRFIDSFKKLLAGKNKDIRPYLMRCNHLSNRDGSPVLAADDNWKDVEISEFNRDDDVYLAWQNLPDSTVQTSNNSVQTSNNSVQTSNNSVQTSNNSVQTSNNSVQTSNNSVQTWKKSYKLGKKHSKLVQESSKLVQKLHVGNSQIQQYNQDVTHENSEGYIDQSYVDQNKVDQDRSKVDHEDSGTKVPSPSWISQKGSVNSHLNNKYISMIPEDHTEMDDEEIVKEMSDEERQKLAWATTGKEADSSDERTDKQRARIDSKRALKDLRQQRAAEQEKARQEKNINSRKASGGKPDKGDTKAWLKYLEFEVWAKLHESHYPGIGRKPWGIKQRQNVTDLLKGYSFDVLKAGFEQLFQDWNVEKLKTLPYSQNPSDFVVPEVGFFNTSYGGNQFLAKIHIDKPKITNRTGDGEAQPVKQEKKSALW